MHESTQNGVRAVSMIQWDGLTPPDLIQLAPQNFPHGSLVGGAPWLKLAENRRTRSVVNEIALLLAQNFGNLLSIYEDMVPHPGFCDMLRTARRKSRFRASVANWHRFGTILWLSGRG